MTRTIGKSSCLPTWCKEHEGRPQVYVRYDSRGFFGLGWAVDEAEADELAKRDLRAKLWQESVRLHKEAGELSAEAESLMPAS